MKLRHFLASPRSRPRAFGAFLLSLALCAPLTLSFAQVAPQPRRQQLLNGLTTLLLPQQGDANVLLKLRVQRGAAFDLAGKEGTMALLGDALFPDPSTHEFVEEELDGRLEVATDYDSITITLAGRANEFERLVELLRNALVSTPLAPETTARLREARLAAAREASAAAATMADRAAASRLYGSFPYGRPIAGTPESLARIEHSDLIFARQRFLHPNNSTLTIIGGVDERRAMRALRQLLGIWRMSETTVPATFQQPAPPAAAALVINSPDAATAEVRLAARGVARNDRDYAAALVLANLARERWQASMSELPAASAFARHEAYGLSGIFLMGAAVRPALAARAIETARSTLRTLASAQPSAEELQRAKSASLTALSRPADRAEAIANLLLDTELHRLASADTERAVNSLTPADIQRASARLFRDAQFAAVAVGDADVLRAEFARANIAVEAPAAPAPANASSVAPTAGQTPTSARPGNQTQSAPSATPPAASPQSSPQPPTPSAPARRP